MLNLVSGVFRSQEISLFGRIKNELFFLHNFLNYYRSKGIKQFIFVDDYSIDGSFEYLCSQYDCVVLRAQESYGDLINGRKAGYRWPTIIAQQFLENRWGLFVDADEFIVLPPEVPNFLALISILDRKRITALPSVVIDFYPASIHVLSSQITSNNQGLFSQYPYFDSRQYIDWRLGRTRPKILYSGVTERLFSKYNITLFDHQGSLTYSSALFLSFLTKMNIVRRREYVFKVPLVKWGIGKEYINDHMLNEPPYVGTILPTAHFQYTTNLDIKIEMAIASGSYYKGSRKYGALRELLARMRNENASFLCSISKRFTEIGDFAAAQILKWDLS